MKRSLAKRVTIRVTVATMAVFLVGCVSIDSPSDLDAFLREKRVAAGIPGMAIGIMTDGELTDLRCYGYADLEAERPVEPSTMFQIASISKTVTATALMVLEGRGELRLDDDISDYLPFRIANPNHPNTAITFRMLLTHTSSIQDNWDLYDSFYTIGSGGGDSPISLDRLVRGYYEPGGEYYDAEKNFHRYAPGSRYEYANMGFALVGYLVQVISGVDFAAFCEHEIFGPLGMHDTSWFFAGLDPDRVAVPYEVSRRGAERVGHYGYASYPDGQLRTTIGDYARFLQLFMDRAPTAILPDRAIVEFLSIQFPDVAPWQAVAWNYNEFENRIVYRHVPHLPAHTGGDPGVVTLTMFDPETGGAVILFANGINPTLRSVKILYLDILIRLCREAGME